MKKKIWILFVLIVLIIGIVCLCLFLSGKEKPEQDKVKEAETVFENFGKGLSDLKIEFTEASIDISDYDVLAAKMFISGESRVAIYYLDEESENYEQVKKDGFIASKTNPELVVSGIVENGYLFYLEQNFPNGNEVYGLFSDLTKK